MNKLLIATLVAGVAVAGLVLYLRQQFADDQTENDMIDAADDAHKTMNRYAGRAERAFDHALN